MLNFNRLVPNRVYRVSSKYSMPYDVNDPMKGSLVTVLSDDMMDTAEFFKSPYIDFKRYKRYYIERKFYEVFAGQQVREVNKQKEVFDAYFGSVHPGTILSITPDLVRNYNVVYEIGQFNELLNSNQRIARKSLIVKSQLKFEQAFDRLKRISKDFPNHKKYLFIPVDKFVDDPKDPQIWVKRSFLDNFGLTFIRHIDSEYSKFKNELKDWTFIFINSNEMFFLNCKDLNEKTPKLLRTLFRRFKSMKGHIETTEVDDKGLTSNEVENDKVVDEKNEKDFDLVIQHATDRVNDLNIPDENKKNILKDIGNIKKSDLVVGTTGFNKVPVTTKDEPKNKTDTLSTGLITKKKDETDESKQPETKTIETDVEDKVKEAVKKELNKAIAPTESAARLARTTKIREDMAKIKVDDNNTIEDLAKKAESKKIDDHPIKSSVINPKLKNIKYDNFEKGYNEKLMDYDMMNILTCFASKDRPLYLVSFNKEDTSTAIDQKYTISCVFEDEFGRRHNMTFDMPKFTNDKFMFLNGSDKIFINQIVPLPITKVAPNQVQMSSNYNKIFITRFGKNVSGKVTKFFKLAPDIDSKVIGLEKGNCLLDNTEYMTSMEYDELSKKYNSITLKNSDITVYLSQKKIREICEAEGYEYDNDTEVPFAINNKDKSVICFNANTGEIDQGPDEPTLTPIDFIIKYLDDDATSREFSSAIGSKKAIYTRAKIMAKDVPVILLVSFLEGLEDILNRLKCNWKFSETRTREDSSRRAVIKFADGFLSYDMYPYNNSLLLNGFYDIPTEEYNFLDFSSKDIYFEIFTKMFGRRNIGNAFENFKQLFMDPITVEILEDLKLPTDFIDCVIYANSLLENNVFDKDGDMKNYRLRSNEMVNDHLYKVLSKAYEAYRMSADNKNPTKFSIKKQDVINDMFNSQVMEEYSNLNPIYEIDRLRATSYKGPGGCNVDKGFKIEKRAYNDSMLGILAQSSPISGNVGISRVLSLDPNIVSLRGYLDVGSTGKDGLQQTNMLSAAELLIPMTGTHDDPQRVGMASTQSRHTIATMDSDVPLFGYGMDKVLSKMISDKFAFKAKEAGTIYEYNEKLGYMIVKYDSGKTEVIDLTDKQSLNTGSGFYISNKLDPIFTEVGTRFEANQVLAANMQFFQYNELTGDVVYKSGPLARVAIMHGSYVYEDSTLVTEAFAKRMGSYVDEVKEIRIGKNSNIYLFKKLGDKIRVNDAFIVFDESYEDDYLNKILEKMNETEKDALINASRSQVKSKWNGEIVDIKIYYTCPKSEMSPTLQKVIADYEKDIKARRKAFESAGVNIKDMTTLNQTDDITVPINGKIAGIKMDEFDILIKFFVKTVDDFGVGDKLSFSTALKGINQGLIPIGQEPYLVSDPNIKIDAFLSLSGIYSRMTNSASASMALNSVLMGAEAYIKDILEDKF